MANLVRRLRQRIRRSARKAEKLSVQSERGIDAYLFRRLNRLAPVRRFVTGWLLLMVLLIAGLVTQNILLSGYYQKVEPVSGGIYKEGIVGSFTNANPLYATSEVDTAVSRLIFAGLFTYNDHGRLVGDLASSYSVDARGTTYTVKLKRHLTWQDGKPLTSADVLFTYHTIQNPDVQSPLQTSWQGINITAPDSQTVTFKLPAPLASFIYGLTTGIVPEHVLASVPAVDMRSADFNTMHPVGAGPFMWREIQVTSNDPTTAEEQIALLPFNHYQGGAPKLEEFVIQAYANPDQLTNDFDNKQLTAAAGLSSVPANLRNDHSVQQNNFLLRAANMIFFKTSSGVLADQKVRSALIQASNVPAIIAQLGYPTLPVQEPLLKGQVAYDPSLVQPSFNLKAAQATLTSDGWQAAKGTRSKNGTPLAFTLTAADTSEDRLVTAALQKQWRAAGVDAQVQLQDPTEFQTTLTTHGYDALLYGISIGVDPDVFVYWHSSQADIRSPQRLNFSEYKNSKADLSLEAGRTRLDPQLRAVKYKPFLEAWQQDAPALGLYQPRVLYLTNGPVSGLTDFPLVSPADRYANVQNWEIRQAKVTQ